QLVRAVAAAQVRVERQPEARGEEAQGQPTAGTDKDALVRVAVFVDGFADDKGLDSRRGQFSQHYTSSPYPTPGRTMYPSSRLTRDKALKHEETSIAWPVCCRA